ncbi:dihydrofolate reductase [Kaistia soli DSM 19436]|uniref:dihydrofolate reductase n=1 Tax=Kaistia soli DSM 19436 TaxID=1122133 RepID=A0A1M5A2B9_9HYPH|nr:dihydrofolate reductase [Kaistia soli DSM 19436]
MASLDAASIDTPDVEAHGHDVEPLKLSIIAAVAENGIIGADGEMPWKLSTDLRRFRSITTGKPVIMGRKTFASIGRPLPNRVNIVVSRDPAFSPEGAVVVPTLEAAISAAIAAGAASDVVEAVVIGGGEIYRAFLPQADRLYITHVEAAPAGDVSFPPIEPSVWRAVSTEAVPAGPADSVATRFTVYERIGSAAAFR